MVKHLTRAQADALELLTERGGEAIKQYGYYEAAGKAICDEKVMDRLAKAGKVRIETVGESKFAVVKPLTSGGA